MSRTAGIVACAALGFAVVGSLILIALHDSRADMKKCLEKPGAMWSQGECYDR